MGCLKMQIIENMTNKHQIEFNLVLEWFKQSEYGGQITVYKGELYDFAAHDSKNCDIIFGFCTRHDENHIDASYIYINGRIAIDIKATFDKWRNCLFYVNFPQSKKEFDALLDLFDFMDENINFAYDDSVSIQDTIKAIKEYKTCKNMLHLIDWEL